MLPKRVQRSNMLEVHWPVVIRVARDIGLHPCGPFFCVRLNPFEQVVGPGKYERGERNTHRRVRSTGCRGEHLNRQECQLQSGALVGLAFAV